jgi:hypothetical protein
MLLMWTLTVASARPSRCAISLLEAPCIRYRRIRTSRSDNCPASPAAGVVRAA